MPVSHASQSSYTVAWSLLPLLTQMLVSDAGKSSYAVAWSLLPLLTQQLVGLV